MSYRTGICPNCGATQNVNTDLEAAACTCCHVAYLVRDALVSFGNAASCVQKARNLLRLNQLNMARAYIIEGLTMEPHNEELLFYYRMCDTNAGGLNGAEFSRNHPYIEPYEELWVSIGYTQAEFYFRHFFEPFDRKRCELAIRHIGGLPRGISGGGRQLYGFAIAGFRGYSSLEQIEFIFSHDTRREVRPYEKGHIRAKESYGFFNNKVRVISITPSMYDIVTGKVVLPNPNHTYEEALPFWVSFGANPAIAALIRRYYPG